MPRARHAATRRAGDEAAQIDRARIAPKARLARAAPVVTEAVSRAALRTRGAAPLCGDPEG